MWFPSDHLLISIGGPINLWVIQNRYMLVLVRVALEKSLVVEDYRLVATALGAVCSYAFKHQLPFYTRCPAVWGLRSALKASVLSGPVPHFNHFSLTWVTVLLEHWSRDPTLVLLLSRAVWIFKVSVQVSRGSLQWTSFSPAPCQMGGLLSDLTLYIVDTSFY